MSSDDDVAETEGSVTGAGLAADEGRQDAHHVPRGQRIYGARVHPVDEDEGPELVGNGQAIEEGRASRAIYPVRAWTDARKTLELRASVGEQIRLLPELPSRMIIIGTSHVVLPEPLGFVDEPRSLVRQPGLVQAPTHWFELLWERATAPPEAGRPRAARAERDRFLLQQLAQGAKDEQIARTLGLSLRTVRRRVADLMTELAL